MKRLEELLVGLPAQLTGSGGVEIRDIVVDSRKVAPGALFFAIRGSKLDGRAFVPQAIAAGAAAVVSDAQMPAESVPVVRIQDAPHALAHIANRFWDFPSRQLLMVGITGTNGKTTTSFLVEHLLSKTGLTTGVMGTIHYRFKQQTAPAPNTTPLASEIQRFLAQIVQGGGRACVMEVSSHALALGRVDGVEFDVAVFTNLTQDHLDFHQTMDRYRDAKKKLFTNLVPESRKGFPRRAIVNGEDPATPALVSECRAPVWTYGMRPPADIYASDIVSDADGSRFTLHGPDGPEIPIRLPLIGHYNVMNALAAAAVGFSQKLSGERVRDALETAPGVPGRMERVDAGQPFTVVVDYAHTDDALRQVMTALRRLKPARLITVFGCGGDRDRTKRPLMGQAASELSDEVIVTSDNPRSEDPARITLDIEVGIRRVRPEHYKIIVDREEAIAAALSIAAPNDIVLIAGKGHENYQILKDRTIPFDDREVARRILQSQRAAS